MQIPCPICEGGAPGPAGNRPGRDFCYYGDRMGKINFANLKKTAYYLKRNGIKSTLGALRERLAEGRQPEYRREPLSRETLQLQREQSETGFSQLMFSIVVPAYRTPEPFLREMLESVISQTYPRWELILADASGDDSVKSVALTYEDSRIRYYRLSRNGGIAENTNEGISLAEGDYVVLLDHDDVLTENALYEMASAIEESRKNNIKLQMLYSDEDKCNGDGTKFYEPHFKEKFNLDLLLSNNYICHLLVMKRELIQDLKLRKEYDGAQDFDLVLRASDRLMEDEREVVHIPLVLYHWRCHATSTAENPRSKLYAYEAGRRAVQDFADRHGWRAKATDTEHVGFYCLKYEGNVLDERKDVGALGGRLTAGRKTAGGRMNDRGECIYSGLPVSFSGYMHRAVLQQDAEVLDIRNLELRSSLRDLFREVMGVDYATLPGTEIFDVSKLPEGTDYIEASVRLCKVLRERGYRLLYLPERTRKLS